MRHRAAHRRGPAVVCAVLLIVLPGCAATDPAPAGAASASSSRSGPAKTAPVDPPPGRDLSPEDPEERAAAAISALDRRAQVRQLFVAGVPLEDLDAGTPLAEDGVGGLFLAGRSTAAAEELAAVTGDWAARAPGPLPWVAVDQEGGNVQTLRGPGFDRLPTALEQGRLPDADLAALADRLGASLARAGVNLNLAPVADVVPPGTEHGNEPIGVYERQYAGTPEEVVRAAGAVRDGLAAHGVTAVLKHFPGLGRVRGNTDTRATVVDDVTTADDAQVEAFGTLARSSAAPFVMTSSATYSRIDPARQAAFSGVVVGRVLRGALGFEGVVISDDLGNAGAVQRLSPGERVVRFLAAGGTLVLTVDAALLPEMVDAVLARDRADPAFAARVDAAVRTALLAKARAGLLRDQAVDRSPD